MDDGAAAIAFRNVSKGFVTRNSVVVAMDDVSFEVAEGEFVAIVGPSGCGKSTTLHLVADILAPTTGDILVRGRRPDRTRRDIGYVFQQDSVLPWRSVIDNIRVGLIIRNVALAEQKQRARESIELVGLNGFERAYPAELSGGMRKRVALATALVYDPAILLMDEPFGALDAQTRLTLHEQLMELWQLRRKTVLFVTHDITEAITLADRVIVMTARPARIKADYKVDLLRPRNVTDARFMPGFEPLYKKIWDDLRPEVAAQQAQA